MLDDCPFDESRRFCPPPMIFPPACAGTFMVDSCATSEKKCPRLLGSGAQLLGTHQWNKILHSVHTAHEQ